MATGVSVKMGVTGVQTFKRDVGDAEASVKALNAALKLNESQLKLNGNQELYMANKVQILKDRIDAQAKVVASAETALKNLKDKGVNPASKEFQDMQTNVYKASTKLINMKAELKDVETNGGGAAKGIDKTDNALQQLNRGKAWDNAAEGIDKLSQKLERGARAALNFGKKILGSVKDATGWADSLLTESMKYDIDPETLQRMQRVADIIDTDVDAIIGAKKRMSKAASGDGAKDIQEMFGISATGKNPDDLFWEIGDAILGMEDAYKREEVAQKVFGRNWNDLLPLFKKGRTEYEKMLEEQNVLTTEQVENLGKADDKIKQVEAEIAQLKQQFWSENADTITKLMQWIIDNSDKVKAGLGVIAAGFGLLKLGSFVTNLGKAIDGFKALGLVKGGTEVAAENEAAQAVANPTTAGGLGLDGWLGIGGLLTIAKGTMWAVNQRLNHRDQVRGTDEYLAAQSSGMEQMLAEWIQANQAMSALETKWNATIEEVDAVQARIDAAKAALDEAEGGADAIKAYSDWRQERSLGNMDWEMPENIDKMTRTMEDSFAGQTQSNSEMTAAANDLKGLPAAVATAVQNGMSSVTIIIDDRCVGAIGKKVGRSIGSNVQALLN